jgi:hypothetical protein
MLRRILSPEEQAKIDKEKPAKALMLNGFTRPSYDPSYDPSLDLDLEKRRGRVDKPTLRIRRLPPMKQKQSPYKTIRLKGAASTKKYLELRSRSRQVICV